MKRIRHGWFQELRWYSQMSVIKIANDHEVKKVSYSLNILRSVKKRSGKTTIATNSIITNSTRSTIRRVNYYKRTNR
jgi:hypothetical protein